MVRSFWKARGSSFATPNWSLQGLVVAVLALVKEEQLRVAAKPELAVDAVGLGAAADPRHGLEEGSVAVGPASAEAQVAVVGGLAGLVARVVVLDLVVVPDRHQRVALAHSPEVGVVVKEGVLVPVRAQSLDLTIPVVAGGVLALWRPLEEHLLVDVVPETDDEVQVVLGSEPRVGGVEARS